jgi:6-pyruvoyltetrahydropterin/6-carboxytetrahydropterin synthase
VHVRGPLDPTLGWVLDYSEIKAAFKPLEEQIDHHYLNEVEGLENPTSENLARWIWQRLVPALPSLSKIVVHETCTSGCIYTGAL